MVEKSLSDIDFNRLTRRSYTPSPAAWEDQVLYFLMLDRFSDGEEQGYRDNDGQHRERRNDAPLPAGRRRQRHPERGRRRPLARAGGTLGRRHAEGPGEQDRLPAAPGRHRHLDQPDLQAGALPGYLSRLRHPELPGCRPALRHARRPDALVRTAHRHGIYVILDIILNHSGNVFSYNPDRYWTQDPGSGQATSTRAGTARPTRSPASTMRAASPACPSARSTWQQNRRAWPDGAIWPAEFQEPSTFTAKGRINNWDYDPEFLEGDFFDLKDIHLGSGTSTITTPRRPCGRCARPTSSGSPTPTSTASASTRSSTWTPARRASSAPSSTSSPSASARRIST